MTTGWKRSAQVAGALALGLLCAGWGQRREDVRVNEGIGLIRVEKARDYAALYKPYAKMASIAYTDPAFLERGGCPSHKSLSRPILDTGSRAQVDLQRERNPLNKAFLYELNAQGWTCLFGHVGKFPCPDARQPFCRSLSGLQLAVWRRSGCQLAVVFRGTDYYELEDWLTNFRWFRRLLGEYDQYHQVHDHIGNIVQRGSAKCRPTRIVAVGHSLGGGLAQHAAYSHPKIRYVYAFDPSPVTGFSGFWGERRTQARTGLGIDRVYETGEVLSGLRSFLGGFTQPSYCNPRFRMVRFNAATGGGVAQHSMGDLARNLNELSRGGKARLREGYYKAATCEEGRQE